MKKLMKETHLPDAISDFGFDGLLEHADEMEIMMLKSENLFLHAVITQIEAACDSAENSYNKDLKNMIRIILSPFADNEDEPEEVEENAE